MSRLNCFPRSRIDLFSSTASCGRELQQRHAPWFQDAWRLIQIIVLHNSIFFRKLRSFEDLLVTDQTGWVDLAMHEVLTRTLKSPILTHKRRWHDSNNISAAQANTIVLLGVPLCRPVPSHLSWLKGASCINWPCCPVISWAACALHLAFLIERSCVGSDRSEQAMCPYLPSLSETMLPKFCFRFHRLLLFSKQSSRTGDFYTLLIEIC